MVKTAEELMDMGAAHAKEVSERYKSLKEEIGGEKWDGDASSRWLTSSSSTRDPAFAAHCSFVSFSAQHSYTPRLAGVANRLAVLQSALRE